MRMENCPGCSYMRKIGSICTKCGASDNQFAKLMTTPTDTPHMTNTAWPYEKELHKEIERLRAQIRDYETGNTPTWKSEHDILQSVVRSCEDQMEPMAKQIRELRAALEKIAADGEGWQRNIARAALAKDVK